MNEIMGGITRIINKDSPDPDLLRSRFREQREEEPGIENKPKPKEKKVKFSKLQWAIIDECVKNGRDYGNYSASLDDIIDVYYGKRSGRRTGKMVAVRRAIRTLDSKGIAKLMPGLLSRVELTPSAVRIAKEAEEKK